MKWIFLAFIVPCLCCNRDNRDNKILFKKTILTPDVLFDSIFSKNSIDSSFQFYFENTRNPYSKNTIRIMIEDSVVFNISNLFSDRQEIQFINYLGPPSFNNYINREYGGSFSKAKKAIVSRLRKYLLNEIYSIGKGNSFLDVQTFFQDSLYSEIKNNNPGFIDKHYEKIKELYPNIEFHYCIGFYKIPVKDNSIIDNLSKIRKLRKINDTIFYYREPTI